MVINQPDCINKEAYTLDAGPTTHTQVCDRKGDPGHFWLLYPQYRVYAHDCLVQEQAAVLDRVILALTNEHFWV
jgi:hypothetical protein